MARTPSATPDIVARPTLIFLFGLVVGIVAWWLLPGIDLSGMVLLAIRVLGGILMAGWIALGIWSARAMQRAGTIPDLSTPVAALVRDGPYRYSRNPIYLAIALLYLGINLLLSNLWGVILLPLWLAIVNRGVILPEERYLDERFGEAYRAYRKRVRRWL